jgi:hypothetical protein
MGEKHYKSKVDLWIALLLLGSLGAMIAVCVAMFADDKPTEAWITAGVCAGLLLLFFLLLFPISYVLASDRLVVRLGVVRVNYPYERIIAAEPTHNPISGYAYSLDRLNIDIRKKKGGTTYILIAPKDKQGFLEDLASRLPDHELKGQRIVAKKAADEPAE